MLLIGVKEEKGWLLSRFNLTYKIGWEQVCKAVYSVYDFYDRQEVLVDGKVLSIQNKEEILKQEEAGRMVIRGISKILNVPMMITFYNQMNAVDVNVACATEEFKVADYQKFNMSMGQYMDSIELAMYH